MYVSRKKKMSMIDIQINRHGFQNKNKSSEQNKISE